MVPENKNNNMEDKRYLLLQESLYWGSFSADKAWYRKILGGRWYLLKIGKDTPDIGMFVTWTKMDQSNWSGYTEIYDEECYEYTGVNTKWKLYKEIAKLPFKWFKK